MERATVTCQLAPALWGVQQRLAIESDQSRYRKIDSDLRSACQGNQNDELGRMRAEREARARAAEERMQQQRLAVEGLEGGGTCAACAAALQGGGERFSRDGRCFCSTACVRRYVLGE